MDLGGGANRTWIAASVCDSEDSEGDEQEAYGDGSRRQGRGQIKRRLGSLRRGGSGIYEGGTGLTSLRSRMPSSMGDLQSGKRHCAQRPTAALAIFKPRIWTSRKSVVQNLIDAGELIKDTG